MGNTTTIQRPRTRIKTMETIKQAILDKILFIGNEIPNDVANDARPKFVVLGTPQELISETIPVQKLK